MFYILSVFKIVSSPEFKNKTYILGVITAVVIWSLSFIATKISLNSLPPLTLGALRFISTTILLGLILVIRRDIITKIKFKDMIRIFISGILGMTIYFSLENSGVRLSTASDAALIIASYPIITLVIEIIVYHKNASWTSFAGVGMTMAGIYLIVNESSQTGGAGRLTGNLILVSAGLIWSLYNFITKKVVNRYPVILITFWQSFAGSIAFLPLAYIEHDMWKVPDLNSVLAFLYLTLFCSVLAFMLYSYGLKETPASTAVMLMNLVPVLGVFFAVFLLNEHISFRQIFSGIIVISGIIIGINNRSRELPPNEEYQLK